MKNQDKKEPKSYLVSALVFNEFNERVKIDGNIAEQLCKRLAKNNHKMCEGRGVLHFDDGKVFFNAEENRLVRTQWTRSCDCINRKIEKDHSLLG